MVLMDREQGAAEMLASRGIRLHSLVSIFKLLEVLQAADRIDAKTAQSVRTFILENNMFRCSRSFFVFFYGEDSLCARAR